MFQGIMHTSLPEALKHPLIHKSMWCRGVQIHSNRGFRIEIPIFGLGFRTLGAHLWPSKSPCTTNSCGAEASTSTSIGKTGTKRCAAEGWSICCCRMACMSLSVWGASARNASTLARRRLYSAAILKGCQITVQVFGGRIRMYNEPVYVRC